MKHNRRITDTVSYAKRHNIKIKVLTAMSYTALGVVASSMIMVGFWLWYPYKTIEVSQPYIVKDKVVKKDTFTSYSFHYCKYTNIQPIVQKAFVDGIVFDAEYASAVTRDGCRDTTVPLHIPETLPTGQYRLRIITQYKMNPLRTITYTRFTDTFKVIE